MVQTIVTHQKPHLDEIGAIWLLIKWGCVLFPGIETAKIIFWATGGTTPDGRAADEYEAEGTLLIGVGGGRFDEHPGENGRKERECAFTLVLKALSLQDDPAIEKIAKYISDNDLKGASHPFDLASAAKALYQQYPNDPLKVIKWVMEGLEAKYQEELTYLTVTAAEFQANAQLETISGPHGDMILATICSDNEQMGKYARNAKGGNAAIVILQRTSGNIAILTNQKFRLTLYDVVQMIRIEERRLNNVTAFLDWRALAAEGRIEGAEVWWFQSQLHNLLNGSTTAEGVPPTKLSLQRIQEIVRLGVNPKAFEPSRQSTCATGKCASTHRNPCPLYGFGLQRCRKIRFEANK